MAKEKNHISCAQVREFSQHERYFRRTMLRPRFPYAHKLEFFQSIFLLQMLLLLLHLYMLGIQSYCKYKGVSLVVPAAPAPIMATDLMRSWSGIVESLIKSGVFHASNF